MRHRSRRNTGPSFDTVELVMARAGCQCERCGAAVAAWFERGVDYSIHHRLPRRMGGTKRDLNRPSNLLLLCGSGTQRCHGEVESRRAESIANGYLLPSSYEPAQAAVLLRLDRWVYLGDDFRYHENPPERVA